VPAQSGHLQRHVADPQDVPVGQEHLGLHRDLRGVLAAGVRASTGGPDHVGQGLPVVGVPVGGDHRGQPVRADEVEQALGLGRGVDQRLRAGAPTAQQVRVVVVRADRELADDQSGQLVDVGRSPDVDVSGVGHGPILATGAARGHPGPGSCPVRPGRTCRTAWLGS